MRPILLPCVVTAALIAGSAPLAQEAGPAQPAPAPIFSVERVKRGLASPSAIDLAPQRPTFSVSVTERLPYDNPFGIVKPGATSWADRVNRNIGSGVAPILAMSAMAATMAGDGSMSAKPLMLMNAVAVGQYVAGRIGQSLQKRKARKTRERVQQELEEFCAANGCVAPPAP